MKRYLIPTGPKGHNRNIFEGVKTHPHKHAPLAPPFLCHWLVNKNERIHKYNVKCRALKKQDTGSWCCSPGRSVHWSERGESTACFLRYAPALRKCQGALHPYTSRNTSGGWVPPHTHTHTFTRRTLETPSPPLSYRAHSWSSVTPYSGLNRPCTVPGVIPEQGVTYLGQVSYTCVRCGHCLRCVRCDFCGSWCNVWHLIQCPVEQICEFGLFSKLFGLVWF